LCISKYEYDENVELPIYHPTRLACKPVFMRGGPNFSARVENAGRLTWTTFCGLSASQA